jgi:replicative DNA helicase
VSQLSEKLSLPNRTFSVSDYEDIFIGAIVSGASDGYEIEKAKEGYFYSQNNKILFRIIQTFKQLRTNCDYISILVELGKEIGSDKAKQYLEYIGSKVPQDYNPNSTLQLLEELFVQRESNNLLERAKMLIAKEPLAASEIIFSVFEKIDSLTEGKVEYDISEEIEKELQSILGDASSSLVIPSGIKGFDSVSGGYATQEITLVGSRPGHGKTTSAVSLALSVLDANPELIVVLFELEMSEKAIFHKFLANKGGVDSLKYRTMKLNDIEKERTKFAAEIIKKYKGRLFIFDNIYDLPTMQKQCRNCKANLAFVDFVTLMEGVDGDDSKRDVLGRIALRTKRFAKAHNMAFVFFTQLNRSVEARETKRPQSSDVSESDQLSQLASDIILLFYKFKYTKQQADFNKIKFIFDKTRYATVKDVDLKINPQFCQITD